MHLIDANTARMLDQKATECYHIPSLLLMENAGLNAARVLLELWPTAAPDGVSILCGRGNNGGDGLTIARYLHSAGIPVEIGLFARRQDLRGDPATNLPMVQALGIPLQELTSEADWREHRDRLLRAPILVDAIFGTGLSKPVEGLLRRVIEDINAADRLVLSIDLPSGLHSDTGQPLGVAVRASATAACAFAKTGLVQASALEFVGELRVVDIGLPRQLKGLPPGQDRLLEQGLELQRLAPPRPAQANKGNFGHVLVVAGSAGMGGAAALTSHGALRAGAGLVTLASPAPSAELLGRLWPEIMLAGLPDLDEGLLSPAHLPHLLALASTRTVLAIGPGLGRGARVPEVLLALLEQAPLPVVLDADALNASVGRLERLRARRAPCIITPHPGEAARLLECQTADVQADRPGAARALVQKTGAVTLLKGARTVVAGTDGRMTVIPTGHAGMASAGTGDVLTGIIAGLLAQGADAESAACLGAYVHGLAGDIKLSDGDGRTLVASDLLSHLPRAFQVALGGRP